MKILLTILLAILILISIMVLYIKWEFKQARKENPDECLICAWHAYAYSNGTESDPMPPDHKCKKRNERQA